jgi:hypothetical protein
MTSPNPMTREELLESAALDAYGLLDDYEAALFTRSYHHATPAVQNEIIHMQADYVSDETLLPAETPNPALRDKVLDAVAMAIETESSQLEPLATIGGRVRRADGEVVGTIRPAASGQFWRAASFILCAAVIVVSYVCVNAYRSNHELTMAFLNNTVGQELDTLIGPPIKDLMLDPNAKRIVLTSKNPAISGKAALYYRENSDDAILVIDGLTTASPEYTFKITDASGAVQHNQAFTSAGHLTGLKVTLTGIAASMANATLQITDRTGAVILASV